MKPRSWQCQVPRARLLGAEMRRSSSDYVIRHAWVMPLHALRSFPNACASHATTALPCARVRSRRRGMQCFVTAALTPALRLAVIYANQRCALLLAAPLAVSRSRARSVLRLMLDIFCVARYDGCKTSHLALCCARRVCQRFHGHDLHRPHA